MLHETVPMCLMASSVCSFVGRGRRCSSEETIEPLVAAVASIRLATGCRQPDDPLACQAAEQSRRIEPSLSDWPSDMIREGLLTEQIATFYEMF